jgi:hypothetical protein
MTILSFLLILLNCLPIPPAPGSDILPPDGFGDGWARSGTARLFQRSDLYGHINGGAELFFEFGFQSLTVQHYRRENAEFSVEIYQMTDPLAATGLYLMNRGKENAAPGFPERHTLNRFQLLFKRDCYYVLVHNLDGDEVLVEDMLTFGRHIASRLPPDGPEEIFDSLPKKGLDPRSVRLIRGPIALQSIYTLGEGDVLQLRGKLTAISGDYRDSSGSHALIIIDYPHRQSCAEAFDHLLQNLDSSLKALKRTDKELVFEDHECKQGSVSLSDRRLTLRIPE